MTTTTTAIGETMTVGGIEYQRVERVPKGLRFDCPAQYQGQIVEHSFAADPRSRYAADCGDLWMRVHDRSVGPDAVTYYRRVGAMYRSAADERMWQDIVEEG